MNLLHIKLKNGEDILAQKADNQTDIGVTISAPVSIHVDPMNGFFAKSWMILSEEKLITIRNEDIMFCTNASTKGQSYYDEFVTRFADEDPEIDKEEIDSLQDLFELLLEAKSSKLH